MLYLVATPIGNMRDITLRALDVLTSCDMIYCEDTRRTAQLLNHFSIEKPLQSCHMHNEKARSIEIADLVRQGKEIVYVSDAGMPGISDPGAILVQTCIEQDLPFTVLPGASAVLTAAVLSGLAPQPFSFFGFLPRENKPRREMLDQIAQTRHLCILYESPHRVRETLMDLKERTGNARTAVLRELTKKFESIYRGTLSDLIGVFEEEPRGECVIAVIPEQRNADTELDVEALLDELLGSMSVKDAAQAASQAAGISRKEAYALALKRKEMQED